MPNGTTTGRESGTAAEEPREEKPSDHDRADGVAIRTDPVVGPPRRLRFDPLDNGQVDLCSEEWTGCKWRIAGRELLDGAVVETKYGDVDLFAFASYVGPYIERGADGGPDA